ncbi:MAG: hypothetical protein PVG75_10175 [Thioalkalispiraceae bacterium]|jgi:hypothetical protein
MKKLARMLGNDFKKAFSALAYEHSGEMLSLRDKKDMLTADADLKIEQADQQVYFSSAERKRIAVLLNDQSPSAVLRYAVNSADRYNADLDIITTVEKSVITNELANLDTGAIREMTIINDDKDLLTSLAKHVQQHPSLLFVVTSDHDTITERYVTARPVDIQMTTPWLVVPAEKQAAA